jgi:hypothetical protein
LTWRCRRPRLQQAFAPCPHAGRRSHCRAQDNLTALYVPLWNAELDLRNLKTTTGMDVLS